MKTLAGSPYWCAPEWAMTGQLRSKYCQIDYCRQLQQQGGYMGRRYCGTGGNYVYFLVWQQTDGRRKASVLGDGTSSSNKLVLKHLLNTIQVIFHIPKQPSPRLKNEKKWSQEFHDFLARCLQKNPDERASAYDLLSVRNAVCMFTTVAPIRSEGIIAGNIAALHCGTCQSGVLDAHRNVFQYWYQGNRKRCLKKKPSRKKEVHQFEGAILNNPLT